MVTKWTFFDPSVPETYTFVVNPKEHKPGARKKNISTAATTAPGAEGRVVMMEGTDEVREGSFSGTLTRQEQYEAFDSWYEHRNQVLLTDDLGRSWWIVITNFDATRVWSATKPWKHTYEVTYSVLAGWSPP